MIILDYSIPELKKMIQEIDDQFHQTTCEDDKSFLMDCKAMIEEQLEFWETP